MANMTSCINAERLFVLTEEFPDGFKRSDGERVLSENGVEGHRFVIQSLSRCGFIKNTKGKSGKAQGYYKITDNGYRAALIFEKAIQRNAVRLGYKLPSDESKQGEGK